MIKASFLNNFLKHRLLRSISITLLKKALISETLCKFLNYASQKCYFSHNMIKKGTTWNQNVSQKLKTDLPFVNSNNLKINYAKVYSSASLISGYLEPEQTKESSIKFKVLYKLTLPRSKDV